jgi:hypothetical protein
MLAQDADLVTCGGFWRFLARTRAWTQLGAFDETYWPAYFEDIDWGHRLAVTELRQIDLPHLGDAHRPDGEPREGLATTPTWFTRQHTYLMRKWTLPDSPRHPPAVPRSIEWDFSYFTHDAAESEQETEELLSVSAQAEGLRHVTAIGTNGGPLATALLAGQPERLVLIDSVQPPEADRLLFYRGSSTVQLIEADPLAVDLEPTDLLLIAADEPARSRLAERHGPAARTTVFSAAP